MACLRRLSAGLLAVWFVALTSAGPAAAASERDRNLCLRYRGDKSPFDQRIRACGAIIAEARSNSTRMSDSFEDVVDALLSRCHTYRYQEKYDLAQRDCDEAFRVFREGARVWGNSVIGSIYRLHAARGALLSSMGQYAKALDEEDKAADSLTHAEAIYAFLFSNRGLTHRALGNFDAALEDYEQAIVLDDKYLPALVNRGAELARRGRRAEALADLERALTLSAADYDFGREMHDRARSLIRRLKEQ